MATVAISALASASAANLTGAAILPITDATTTTVGMTLAQLRTSLYTSGIAGYASTDIASFPAIVGVNTAAITGRALQVGGSVTASAAVARGSSIGITLVAAANNDALTGLSVSTTFTPGAFTGLTARGLLIAIASVAAFTSPADPAQIDIGVLTGTGATNAYAIRLAPPTGATNNYLLSHTTPATFNVKAAGDITTATTLTVGTTATIAGAFGCNTKTAQTAAASGGAVSATGSTNVAPYGYAQAQADGIVTLLNNIRAALVANGIMS